MRIALVINTSWNIVNFRSGLVKHLQSLGHEVICIAPKDSYSPAIKKLGCRYYPINIENKGVNPFHDLKLIRVFYIIYKRIMPDVILHYTIKPNIYGAIAAKRLGIPCINNVSGLGTVFLHKGITSTVAKRLYRFAFQFPFRIFFQNQDDLTLFEKKHLLKHNNVALLPGSGVDLTKFTYQAITERPLKVFLMIARLLYDKGVIEYVEAAKQVKEKYPEVEFWLCGKVEEEANLGVKQGVLNEWVETGLVKYFGHVEHIASFIAQSDVVVLPSYREGTPKSLLEAAAVGRPLIATNVPGCKEVVKKNLNGWLCKAKNANNLAEKMIEAIESDYNKRLEYGKSSRKLAEDVFDEKYIFKLYEKAINDIQDANN